MSFSASGTGRIKQLEQDVVHKIAAGEIIVSPKNALKELLENAIDSGATKIDVVVADGGFKLLHITDNGSGIHKDDLPILCERFTTSKIQEYKDLEKCSTLGFRGEALASISYISNLQVVTKTRDSPVATRATFEAGKLVATKPTAGLDGTQIVVENLFYNNPVRKQSLRASKKQEYAQILEIVSRYAVRYKGTFTCKQQGDAQPTVVAEAATIDKLRSVFGAATASALVLVEAASPEHGMVATGYVSSLQHSTKNSHVIFVNGRLVECKPLSRALQLLYSAYIPKDNPFVYLSLELAPENVDVNVHPTKSQVSFLHETEIVTAIVEAVQETLQSQDTSRTFSTQTLLTSSSLAPVTPANSASTPQRYEHKLVRTDPKQTQIAFVRATAKTATPILESPTKNRRQRELNSPSDTLESSELSEFPVLDFETQDSQRLGKSQGSTDMWQGASAGQSGSQGGSQGTETEEVPNLQSIATLKEEINNNVSLNLTQILSEHTYVGLADADRALAAIQYDVRLYLADYNELTRALFYQIALVDFATFGTIHLGSGLPLEELLALHDDTAKLVPEIIEMAPMLELYFKIRITPQGTLNQVPLLLADYTPPMSRLPRLVADLNQLCWADELECLGGICRAIAAWHVPDRPSSGEIRVLFDALKVRFVATMDLREAVVEIASLPGLYKVFERC